MPYVYHYKSSEYILANFTPKYVINDEEEVSPQ